MMSFMGDPSYNLSPKNPPSDQKNIKMKMKTALHPSRIKWPLKTSGSSWLLPVNNGNK